MRNPALESDEDFIASCFEGIHPALRRLHVPDPDPEEGQCAACGKWIIVEALTKDGLCHVCDEIVADLERGIIS